MLARSTREAIFKLLAPTENEDLAIIVANKSLKLEQPRPSALCPLEQHSEGSILG